MMRLFTMMSLILLWIVSVNAQQLGTTGLYMHGTNSSGTSTNENTDSVTVGAIMDYYVAPDPLISPSYNFTVDKKLNLNSTFTWAAIPNTGVTITKPKDASYAENYVSIHWPNSIGAINLDVQEKANSGSCSGSTRTIPILVIAKPTVTGGAAPAAQCTSDPGTLSFQVPVALTSDLAVAGIANRVKINYTVTNPNATVFQGATDIDLDKTATFFTLSLATATQYGNYTVTINSVSDRISRKSNVAGTLAAPTTITLTVNRVPVTGPIYHLPNM